MHLTYVRGDDLRRMTLSPDDGVRVAMKRMNEAGRTFVVLVEDGRLAGAVSDGDIRRHLADGGEIDGPVHLAANRTPVTLPPSSTSADVRQFMIRRSLDYLPLVQDDQLDALCILETLARPNDLTAVILAGGLGTRLAPLTDDCPKPLLPLGDQPILSHILDHLRDHGVHRFVFSVSYLSERIVDYYDDGSRWDCFVEYVHENKRLGTGGPLSLVPTESLSDPFLVMNGDVLNDLDVGALVETHMTNGWDATMAVRSHTYTVPYGVVKARPDGVFTEVSEKPVLNFQINGGMYMLSKSALEVIPNDEFYDMPTLFQDLPQHGLRGGVYSHAGRWVDIGNHAEYARAQEIFEGSL